MRRSNWCALVTALLATSACATSYPPLYTPIVPGRPSGAPGTPVQQILDHAGQIQGQYARYYRSTARQQDLLQLPLIAAAAGAAAVLYDNPEDAGDTLAEIGIATAAFSATRSTLFPPRLPELYIMGHSAMACVRAEGYLFAADDAVTIRDLSRGHANELSRQIASARQVYQASRLSASASPALREDFQLATTALNDTIIAAAQSLATVNQHLGSFSRAEVAFASAVAAVQSKVASLARNGRITDFATLRQNFTDSIASAGTSAPSTAGALPAAAGLAPLQTRSDAQVIEDLRQTSRTLAQTARDAVNATPDYSGALGRVAVCADVIR